MPLQYEIHEHPVKTQPGATIHVGRDLDENVVWFTFTRPAHSEPLEHRQLDFAELKGQDLDDLIDYLTKARDENQTENVDKSALATLFPNGSSSELAFTNETPPRKGYTFELYQHMLTLLMCDDPSELTDKGRAKMERWANAKAQSYGFADWIEAYHFRPEVD